MLKPVVKAPVVPVMSVALANALLTHAPMTEDEVKLVEHHYRTLYSLLEISGPAFTPTLRTAKDYQNRAVIRYRKSKERAEMERRERAAIGEMREIE